MVITEVRVKLCESNNERRLAFCSFTFDNAFLVRDLEIIAGPKGMFVVMPRRKLADRCPDCRHKNHHGARFCNQCAAKLHADIAQPVHTAARELVQDAAIKAYLVEKEHAKRPGYACTYDEPIPDCSHSHSGNGSMEHARNIGVRPRGPSAGSKAVYVIMPFSRTKTRSAKKWTETFENVFSPAFTDLGYRCSRAEPRNGSLIGNILDQVRSAWLVLADITDGNPNVLYELGVRHSMSQRTIVVANRTHHVPSDLRGYWWVEYGTQPAQVTRFRADMKRIVGEIEADPERKDSPVSDFVQPLKGSGQ